MKLERSKRSNRFCGPAALALIAGIHVDEAAFRLRVITGKRAVKGCSARTMLSAMYHADIKTTPVWDGCGFTIARGEQPNLNWFIRAMRRGAREVLFTQPVLVLITGHYVVVQGRMLYDNKHPEGVRLTECPYLRKRVVQGWTCEKKTNARPA